ncbi:MAG: helix-turn-helix transcriptional regulator [Micrococcales bacterium]|nr:helix-turn-helix transcriptional regulator [Micrococcales bacterium]
MSRERSPRLMEHPDLEQVELPTVLFALSDASRLALVRELAVEGPRTVEACRETDPDVPKSTFSHHLRTLREAGLIRNEPAGRHRVVTLRRDELEGRFPGLLDAVLRD